MLARLENAGRISLTVGFAAMVLSIAAGTVIGVLAGYYGGIVGAALMRFVDAVLCFPSIFLLLALAAFIEPTLLTITVIIAATGMDGGGAPGRGADPCTARSRFRCRGDGVGRARPRDHVPRTDPERACPYRCRRHS